MKVRQPLKQDHRCGRGYHAVSWQGGWVCLHRCPTPHRGKSSPIMAVVRLSAVQIVAEDPAQRSLRGQSSVRNTQPVEIKLIRSLRVALRKLITTMGTEAPDPSTRPMVSTRSPYKVARIPTASEPGVPIL